MRWSQDTGGGAGARGVRERAVDRLRGVVARAARACVSCASAPSAVRPRATGAVDPPFLPSRVLARSLARRDVPPEDRRRVSRPPPARTNPAPPRRRRRAAAALSEMMHTT